MAEQYIGAIDLGTSGVRCVIFDRSGVPLSSSYRELSLSYPQPGWVEQDPDEIFEVAVAVMREALSKGSLSADDIVSFGLTNQRETTIVWERATGEPVYPAIVWQDRRTAEICTCLRDEGVEDEVRTRTGLALDPYFSATKVAWILEHVPRARERAKRGEILFGTPDTWLLWKLTGEHMSDASNASRTLLFNIQTLSWDDELTGIFSIPKQCLPQVRPSLSVFARIKEEIIGRAVPITGVLGDQQAALFGHAGFAKGSTKVTWGTGAFLLSNTGSSPAKSAHRLLATVFYSSDEESNYGLEGSVFVAGAAIQWLRDGLRIIDDAAQSDELACSVGSTNGVYFVPALTGLGAPYWDPRARGTIVGITRGTRREHIVRATLEAIAYQTHDIVRATEDDLGLPLEELHVDGGAARNAFLCQFQADILGIPVIRPEELEMTARGAAFAAGLTVGFWRRCDEILDLPHSETRFTPKMGNDERERLLSQWARAVERAKDWQR